MDSQSFPMCHAEDQDPLFIGPTRAQFCTNDTVDNQIFPIGFSMDPTAIQQHYNLTTPFGSYTQTSTIDMKPAWPTPQQCADPSSQSPVQQGLPPLVPRLSTAKSLVSDEGDDTSEPTSPRDEASERRKEVSGYFCRFYPSQPDRHVILSLPYLCSKSPAHVSLQRQGARESKFVSTCYHLCVGGRACFLSLFLAVSLRVCMSGYCKFLLRYPIICIRYFVIVCSWLFLSIASQSSKPCRPKGISGTEGRYHQRVIGAS
jgi:hypothetical protein